MSDPRLSDEATGLTPLEQVEDDKALLVLAWHTSEGIAMSQWRNVSGFGGTAQPVKFLHVRGLVRGEPGGPDVEWAQAYLAIPSEVAMELAAALVKGTTD